MSNIPFGFWKSASKEATIVKDGLILHLDAEDYTSGTTTWIDRSPAGSDMTMFHNGLGLPIFTTDNGGTVFFSRSNQNWGRSFIGVNATSPNVVSIEFWGKLSPSEFGAYMPVAFPSYNFFYINAGFGFNTFAGDVYGVSSNTKENWGTEQDMNHYTLVMYQDRSYTNNEIWINGVKAINVFQVVSSENTTNRTFPSDGAFSINGFGSFIGDIYIGQCRVYNRKLTENEIINNYNVESEKYGKISYLPRVANNDLTLYYDFKGETDWYGASIGRVKDYSGRMERGFLTSGINNWNSGNGGHYRFRANSNEFINTLSVASTLGFFLSSASFVAVVRTIDHNNNGIFFSADSALSPRNQVQLSMTNRRFVYTHGETNIDTFSTFGPTETNEWYHVIFTYNSTNNTVKVYINGVEYITDANQSSVNTNETYLVCLNQGNPQVLDIGLFMVYNRVLSQSEVTETFNNQKSRFEIEI